MLGGVGDISDWVVVLVVIVLQKVVDPAQIDQDAEFPIRFALGKYGRRVLTVRQRRDDALLLHQGQFDE